MRTSLALLVVVALGMSACPGSVTSLYSDGGKPLDSCTVGICLTFVDGSQRSDGGSDRQPVDQAVPASCKDQIKNNDETDVDCGGTVCPACDPGKKCLIGGDCVAKVCSGGICANPSCTDKVKNGAETDVDCGGDSCASCSTGKACLLPQDCATNLCSGGICVNATCVDKVQDGTETDVDCGGGTCPACGTGKTCAAPSDCVSKVCTSNRCVAASCSDKVLNGNETDVDCGGGSCSGCAVGKICALARDCLSQACLATHCEAWLNAGYRFRVPITISNSGAALSDYQVLVTFDTASRVQSSKLRSDCADLRFADADKTTALSHWLESGANTTGTRLWVRVPSIPATTTKTIYLYYGNATASDASSFNGTFLDPNGEFEMDAVNTSKSSISYWDHESGTTGETGYIEAPLVSGSAPAGESATISASRRYGGLQSFYSYLKNANTGGNSDAKTRTSVQRIFTENAYRAITSASSLFVWMSTPTYTTSSRWRWQIAVIISDGTSSQTQPKICRDWGNHEGCGSVDAYDYYDQMAVGADGQTWKRYPISVPAGYDKTSLRITIGHLQDSWDGTTADSTVYYDTVSGYRLRRYRSPAPSTAVGSEQAK